MTAKTGKKIGRPSLFDDPGAMGEMIGEYFAKCEADPRPPTIAGLCYFLGFDDRHAMAEYETRPAFSATVKNARLRIEQDRSERLLGKDTFTPGVIFDLKNNHGWKDKQEVEHSGGFSFHAQRLDDKV